MKLLSRLVLDSILINSIFLYLLLWELIFCRYKYMERRFLTFKVIKCKATVLIIPVIINVTQRNAIGNVSRVLKHIRVETANEIIMSLN